MKASRTRFIVWDDRLCAWSKQRVETVLQATWCGDGRGCLHKEHPAGAHLASRSRQWKNLWMVGSS